MKTSNQKNWFTFWHILHIKLGNKYLWAHKWLISFCLAAANVTNALFSDWIRSLSMALRTIIKKKTLYLLTKLREFISRWHHGSHFTPHNIYIYYDRLIHWYWTTNVRLFTFGVANNNTLLSICSLKWHWINLCVYFTVKFTNADSQTEWPNVNA